MALYAFDGRPTMLHHVTYFRSVAREAFIFIM